MSLRAYAKHRKVRLSAVQRAIKDGRIATEPSGKINPEVCDLAWDAATDPSKQRKKVVPRRVTKNAEKFAEARASSEDYKAKLFQVKFEQIAGKLVDAQAYKKRTFENARALRDALLNLPNQMANDLASEVDPVKVANLLTIEITRCLGELSGPRLSAAQTGLTPPLGPDPAFDPDQEGGGEDEFQPDPVPEDEDAEDELELDGLPVEAPK